MFEHEECVYPTLKIEYTRCRVQTMLEVRMEKKIAVDRAVRSADEKKK
jgi:hypothetical protein